MTFARPDGSPVTRCNRVAQPRRTPTPAQARALRNMLLLSMVEGKVPHPVSGRPYRFSAGECAAMLGLTREGVLNALRTAQYVRQRILAERTDPEA